MISEILSNDSDCDSEILRNDSDCDGSESVSEVLVRTRKVTLNL